MESVYILEPGGGGGGKERKNDGDWSWTWNVVFQFLF
jgi:hypothetical protein